ncbi:hypothetical protein PENVUL_c084G02008 [Penicillium vulpinum]|uniref:FAD-binding domain-containing protein n=1 Tax=Penicillium vulpinum TaxID=29845 RepID=A0A1V6R6Z6_9EURO|nr:hypothetical protein PENVUL_c084G02008 [Penicillium vulpinum]
MEPKDFKVIIIGGSVAGLTLALSLSKIGIDYIVLEKRAHVAPQEGASIGILPHGGRILDQLGLFGTVEESIEPLHTAHIHFPDGFEHTNASPSLLDDRFGLPLAFLERQKMLQILFDAQPHKSKILCGKKVKKIDDFEESMTVYTEDGSTYTGDLVVGADGVHSRARTEMWQIAEKMQPGIISNAEKSSLTVQYTCVFGISTAVPGLVPGEQVASFNEKRSFLTFPGKNGRTFWFLIKRLGQEHAYSSAPRFSSKDTETICHQFLEDIIYGDVRFNDLWSRKEVCSVTALEEGTFRRWSYRRIVCVGDSMHKMAPNTGQGANCAIEDVAALANMLHTCVVTTKRHCKPTTKELSNLLEGYTKTRLDRIEKVYKASRLVVRLQARDTLFLRIMGRYYIPHSGDVPADVASKMIAGAVALDFLPLPSRCGPGWSSFKTKERRSIRWIEAAAIPLVLIVSIWLWQVLVRDEYLNEGKKS